MSGMNRVVAHYLDGRLVKGTTEDFVPSRPQFHLYPVGAGAPVVIDVDRLKAVFFVHDLAGDNSRDRAQGFGHLAGEADKGKKIAIQFKDGEVFFGYTLAYTNARDGFYVVPADPRSNNIRVYVLRNAAHKILVGVQAEALARAQGEQAA